MKKIRISNETNREVNSVRTARRFYSLQIPEQDIIFTFKNKNKLDAFITDLRKEIDLFIIVSNQIISDLYSIYRQNWHIYKGNGVAAVFLNIDNLLNKLTDFERGVFYIFTDMGKLVNNIYSIITSLTEMAKVNKNYSLNRFVSAFEYQIDTLTANIFNFGKSGKWAAYSQVYDTKKLY